MAGDIAPSNDRNPLSFPLLAAVRYEMMLFLLIPVLITIFCTSPFVIIYFLSFLLANIFYFKTLDIYIILIVFFIAILSIIIYKKKRLFWVWPVVGRREKVWKILQNFPTC